MLQVCLVPVDQILSQFEESVIEQQDSMDEANQDDAFSELLEEESTEKDTAS